MNKSKNAKPTTTPTDAATSAPQTKRYDETFQRQAVENWIKPGQPGTQIAAELGWKPAHTFEKGIRETVRWYLDQQPWVKTVLADKKSS